MSEENQKAQKVDDTLIAIPAKKYFAIGETARLCDIKPHVLRYWEQEFVQLRPAKRRGNRRYYQHKDVVLISQIKDLLYGQGYTINGAKEKLAGKEPVHFSPEKFKEILRSITKELENIVEFIENS